MTFPFEPPKKAIGSTSLAGSLGFNGLCFSFFLAITVASGLLALLETDALGTFDSSSEESEMTRFLLPDFLGAGAVSLGVADEDFCC